MLLLISSSSFILALLIEINNCVAKESNLESGNKFDLDKLSFPNVIYFDFN